MRVFVAGATGVLGRRAVPALAAAGHEVTALVRSPAKAALHGRSAATPVQASLFDPDELRAAIAGHDAVCNWRRTIPPCGRRGQSAVVGGKQPHPHRGSRNLVDAALATGVACYVQESIAFLYGDMATSDRRVDDSAPGQRTDGPGPRRGSRDRTFRRRGRRGVVLRFGGVVASDSDQTLTILRAARRGLAVEPGRGESWFPSIAADDAATAVVAALAAPTGTYDVVDDEPLLRRDSRSALAAAVGADGCTRCRARASGRPARRFATRLESAISRRDRLGTTRRLPARRLAGDGSRGGIEPALSVNVRVLLWLLALGNLGVGIQAAFTPRSFYDDFPLGRGWVAMDGPTTSISYAMSVRSIWRWWYSSSRR